MTLTTKKIRYSLLSAFAVAIAGLLFSSGVPIWGNVATNFYSKRRDRVLDSVKGLLYDRELSDRISFTFFVSAADVQG
jgi:hypothetical protein